MPQFVYAALGYGNQSGVMNALNGHFIYPGMGGLVVSLGDGISTNRIERIITGADNINRYVSIMDLQGAGLEGFVEE
jgi:hypothetical protein